MLNPPPILGRGPEIQVATSFLAALTAAPHALVLAGEFGIGKSTVWEAVVRTAAGLGYRVLDCRPAEAEAGLSFAALGDLLEAAPPWAMDALPGPQRRALRIAMLLDEPDGGVGDQRAIGLAFRGVLQRLAGESPVVVAIDDLQWLDGASARAVEYGMRRLDREPDRAAGRGSPGGCPAGPGSRRSTLPVAAGDADRRTQRVEAAIDGAGVARRFGPGVPARSRQTALRRAQDQAQDQCGSMGP